MQLTQWMVFGLVGLLATSAGAKENSEREAEFQKHKERQIHIVQKRLDCLKAANSKSEMVKCNAVVKKERLQLEQQRIQEQLEELDEK